MKASQIRALFAAMLLSVALTACQPEQPAPDTTPNSGTTTSTEAITTTTSTTTTTTSTTTTTTAETTTTTTTTATTTTTTTTTTTATTTENNDPYAPYEDKSRIPGQDKQKLLFNVMGEDVELTFEKAMVYPEFYDCLMWHYTGTTKKGVAVTCKVAAEQNRIYQVSSGNQRDEGKFDKEDARACLKQYFKQNNVPLDANDADITCTYARYYYNANNELVTNTISSFYLKVGDDGNFLRGTIYRRNGKLYVTEIRAGHYLLGVEKPDFLGDDLALVIPRWINE